MTKASDNVYPRLLISEGGSTSTPAAGRVTVYAKSDGLLYAKDDAGTETPLGESVATDAIWAAEGDIVYGTGPDAATVLTAADDGDVLTLAAGIPSWAPPAAGGGFPLDDITLDGTCGDHFDGTALDVKWTPIVITDKYYYLTDSLFRHSPIGADNWGILEPWTPTDEADIRMAASAFFGGVAERGLGLVVLDSSGTGVWIGGRETSRLGIHAVTTYAIADEPAVNQSLPGLLYLGEGRKTWWRIVKQGVRYRFFFSMDGQGWTQENTIAYQPTAFTPSQIGFLVGMNTTDRHNIVSVDWINVHQEWSVGNNLMITPTSGTVTASAATTTGGAASDVIDGVNSDEWYVAKATATIWWAATFSAAQSMNRLQMRTRGDAWGAGYVEFSDGSVVPFYAPASGWTHVDFDTKSTTLVKVWCLKSGNGDNPGFQEIEAYLAS